MIKSINFLSIKFLHVSFMIMTYQSVRKVYLIYYATAVIRNKTCPPFYWSEIFFHACSSFAQVINSTLNRLIHFLCKTRHHDIMRFYLFNEILKFLYHFRFHICMKYLVHFRNYKSIESNKDNYFCWMKLMISHARTFLEDIFMILSTSSLHLTKRKFNQS